MAEKFCNQFGSGPHHLKIGKSFEKKNGNSVFHSIRYDFTPLSVDEESMGKLEVQENSGVSVSLPHNDGVNATNYKGQAKPASTKDCILIIDHETGELTLERLSNQILLKKTRPEKPEKSQGNMGFQLPSDDRGSSAAPNPYLVKPEPKKPTASAYQVKAEPESQVNMGFQLPSDDRGSSAAPNPYLVKPEPKKPTASAYQVKAEPESQVNMGFQLPSDDRGSSAAPNPYLVKPEPKKPPASAYQVKREPDKPRVGSGGLRPLTPGSSSSKQRPAPAPVQVSPIHSNKNSPLRPGVKPRGLSESSDSNSSSSSDSDSDSDSNASSNEKNCPLEAAMKAESNTASSTFSMPGDVSDLFSGGGGQLPTARPQKLPKNQENMKASQSPAQPRSSVAGPASMPSLFTDLGDDLQLTDESDTD